MNSCSSTSYQASCMAMAAGSYPRASLHRTRSDRSSRRVQLAPKEHSACTSPRPRWGVLFEVHARRMTMLKTNWPMFACTLAIIATLIGCTWWLRNAIGSDLNYVLQDLEQLQRR